MASKPTTYPLVTQATAARARASLTENPAKIEAAQRVLNEAKVLGAIQRAGLTEEQAGRVAVALLTDDVEAWLRRSLADAPRALDPATKAKVVRLLAAGGGR